MKKLLLLSCLLFGAAGSADLSAQSTWGKVSEDQYNADVRQKLSIDTTLPDYSIYKVDAKVMGPRLASILQELCANYKRSDYHSILSRILCDQTEGLDFCTIEKMGLVNVTKSGSTITIRFKTKLGRNPLDLKKSDLLFTFIDGVSERKLVNSLFTTLSRYIKE